jgi:hypothetical protein
MIDVCGGDSLLVAYPPDGLINPNVLILYNYTKPMDNPDYDFFYLFGNRRCRGYLYQTVHLTPVFSDINVIAYSRISNILCIDNDYYGDRNLSSSYQNNKFCWNDSLTFNGRPYAVNPNICIIAGECISKYRIRDGLPDCLGIHDEKLDLDKNDCPKNVGRHRFQCFNDERKCLTLDRLGTGISDCLNSYDERWYGKGSEIRTQFPCSPNLKIDCDLAKKYIQQSSVKNSTDVNSVNLEQRTSIDRMPFRYYCDSFWDFDKNVDEKSSSCQHWICQNNQYQCQTGQCIELDWVCDGEWDCSDASDEEALVLMGNWSNRNSNLSNLSSLLEKCRKLYSKSPFSNICKTSFEFGCYLSRVSNPLDIQSNRPCINLTQIGDGVEDCYNAYDEKNTFTSSSIIGGMWGFSLRCEGKSVAYADVCSSRANCSDILCSRYGGDNGSCSDEGDFICLIDNQCKKKGRCDKKSDCFYGEDEYWCPSGTIENVMIYRSEKKRIYLKLTTSITNISFPIEDILESNERQLSKSIINLRNDQHFTVHSYKCNQGIAVLEMNETKCLCPPTYYGDLCEFYSDRITVIAQVDQKTELKTIYNATLKIKANFLFNHSIIDHHEFYVDLLSEKTEMMKHKFYLLYSRSAEMLGHKQRRYFNRTDIINNHPYSVHFVAFVLGKSNSIEEIGSWNYPIYFDYLPAFRLAVVLKFPSWFGNETLDPCSNNSCNENSTCFSIFNQNNSYYCSCKSGYYGINCAMYEPQCETYCSTNALCLPNSSNLQTKTNKLYCICKHGHFGPRCNLKYHDCNSNACLNNGTCFPNYDLSGERLYLCQCSARFYGYKCEYEKASIHINLNLTNVFSTRASVVQFYDYQPKVLLLIIAYQKVYIGVPSSISFYRSTLYAPPFGILKIHNGSSQPQYFLIYCLFRQTQIKITPSPQYCPHTSLLLSEGQFLINESIHI